MAREQRSIPETYGDFRDEVLRIIRQDNEYKLLSGTVHELRENMASIIQKVDNIDKNLVLYREDSKEFRREIKEDNEKFRDDILGRFEGFRTEIREDNEKFRDDILGRFEGFRTEIRDDNEKFRDGILGRFEGIDQRFEQIDQRFERIDQRFERIDQRFDHIDQRFEHIDQNFMEVFKALNRQIYWMVGSIFAVGGLLLGFIKL